MVTTLASVKLKLMVDISVDTMVVMLPDTLEAMVTTLASVKLKLSLKRMLDIFVDIWVDTMALLLPDTLEAMVTILASVKLKRSLKRMLDMLVDISVDTMVDSVATMAVMLDTVDTSDKLLNCKVNKELFPKIKLILFFDLNKW